MRTWLISATLTLLLTLGMTTGGLAAGSAATPTPAPKPAAAAPTAAPTKAAPTKAPLPPTPQPTTPPATVTTAPAAKPQPTPTAEPAAPAVQQTVQAQVAAATVVPAATPAAEQPTGLAAAAVQQTVEAQVAAASKATSTSGAPAATAASTPTETVAGVRSAFSIAGVVFLDLVGSGYVDGAPGVPDVVLRAVGPSGREWQTKTNAQGIFKVDGLAPGTYHLTVQAPRDLTAGARTEQDVKVEQSAQAPLMIALSPVNPTAVPVGADGEPRLASDAPTATPTTTPTTQADESPTAEAADASEQDVAGEQDAATLSLINLPLRFAPGRDTLAQVARRTLADGSLWLGVPFRTQIDGTEYQFVNCGPASLTMVLAGFGLDVGPNEVRDYLNSLTQNFSTDVGTSLDVLSAIAKKAGLVPVDLYSNQGGYRAWTTDAIRWHVEQGHPVITLVKYHNLPGHFQSSAETDHYIVITGLTPDGFIYNDAAFATTVGYGLEIKEPELETAWDNSSIPHNAVALALPQAGATLSFPERPKTPTPEVHHVQGGPLFGTEADDAPAPEQLPLPAIPATPAPAPTPDPVATVEPTATDVADPVGATSALIDPSTDTTQVVVPPDPGPLRLAPEIVVILGLLWTSVIAWSSLTAMARRLPAMWAGCVRVAALLACFHLH